MERMDNQLLSNIKANLTALEKLLEESDAQWGDEDSIYRFYHHSFKVYRLQGSTKEMVDMFKSLMPGVELNKMFTTIIDSGTNKVFTMACNQRWMEETRPILEAFFHAKFMLHTMVKYGKTLEEAPQWLPSGWAAILYLYNMR